MSSDQGFILFPRSQRDHPLFQDPDKLGAWLWIMLAAAHTAYDDVFQGRTVHLEPGQLTFSIRFLVTKWGWSDGKVQRFLGDLRRAELVTTDPTTGQNVITICNWDEIQRRNTSATTPATTGSTTPTTTKKKQLKQLKKNMLVAEGFEIWWPNYPRPIAKQAASKAYTNVIAAGLITETALLAATIAFAASCVSTEQRFIPHPATWLNGRRFDDVPRTPAIPIAAAAPAPAEFSDERWQHILRRLAERGEWLDGWGPRPGEPGCLVPSRLLVAVQRGPARAIG